MKTEKEIMAQLRTLNQWISSFNPNENKSLVSHLCAYYDVLQWVLNDNGRWVEDYGLYHLLEESKKC